MLSAGAKWLFMNLYSAFLVLWESVEETLEEGIERASVNTNPWLCCYSTVRTSLLVSWGLSPFTHLQLQLTRSYCVSSVCLGAVIGCFPPNGNSRLWLGGRHEEVLEEVPVRTFTVRTVRTQKRRDFSTNSRLVPYSTEPYIPVLRIVSYWTLR